VDAVIAQPEADLNAGDLPAIESVPAKDGSEEETSGNDGT
jgi:hypothetical protein